MQMQQLEGIIAGRYEIQRPLARGGMSLIYLARDIQSDQAVAIKLVHDSASEYCERFRREVQAIARFEHEHILPALAYGENGPWYYLVMPYIEYGTLYTRLNKGPLDPEEVGELLAQLADALHYAHDHGVVHRDIKPSNVLLQDGRHVYLADFGLVKAAGGSHSLTRSGYLIGTPEYMAPELVDQPATVTSDVYAVGVLLYQMLTGRVPFKGNTPVVTVWKHMQELPEPLSAVNPAIPYAIEQVVLQALAKNPQERFQSVADLAQAYQQALDLELSTVIRSAVLDGPTLELAAVRVVPLSVVPTPPVRHAGLYLKFYVLAFALLLTFCCVLFALLELSGK